MRFMSPPGGLAGPREATVRYISRFRFSQQANAGDQRGRACTAGARPQQVLDRHATFRAVKPVEVLQDGGVLALGATLSAAAAHDALVGLSKHPVVPASGVRGLGSFHDVSRLGSPASRAHRGIPYVSLRGTPILKGS